MGLEFHPLVSATTCRSCFSAFCRLRPGFLCFGVLSARLTSGFRALFALVAAPGLPLFGLPCLPVLLHCFCGSIV
jgi:hypothetical protein